MWHEVLVFADWVQRPLVVRSSKNGVFDGNMSPDLLDPALLANMKKEE